MEVRFYIFLLTCCVMTFAKKRSYFVHVTDLHYDPAYSTSGTPSEMCHDVGNSSQPLSPWGNFVCDAPWILVQDALDAMTATYPKPDFVIWTGDTPPHVKESELSWDYVYELIDNATLAVLEAYPDIPIFPSLGNHDAYPQAQVPLAPSQYYSDILDRCHWNDMIKEEAEQKQFLDGGFYKVQISPTLDMLVLNTIFYYVQDEQIHNITDPDHQFNWLESHLLQAREDARKVYISAHIAPGTAPGDHASYFPQYNKRMTELLRRYPDVIAATFWGHEHNDHLQVILDEAGDAAVSMFLSPAVTPLSNRPHNPAFRMFEYDPETGHLYEMSTYYLNLTAAVDTGVNSRWQLAYNFTSAYSMPDVSAQSIHHMATNIMTDMDTFTKYFGYYTTLHDTDMSHCNHTCRQQHYCAVVAVDLDDYAQCVTMSYMGTDANDDTYQPPDIHVYRSKYDITVMLYVLASATIVLLTVVFAVCAFRTQQLHAQYKYEPVTHSRTSSDCSRMA